MLTGLDRRLGQIYGAVDSPALWPELLDGLVVEDDMIGACLALERGSAGCVDMLWSGYDPDIARDYQDYWSARCPWTQRLYESASPGQLLTSDDVVRLDDWLRSPIYNEFAHRLDMNHAAGVFFDVGGGRSVRLAFQRSGRQGPIVGTTRCRIELLIPHVAQALRLAHSRTTPLDERMQSLLTSATAAFVVDRQLKIHRRNLGAEELLREPHPFSEFGTQLLLGSPARTRALSRLVKQVLDRDARSARSVLMPEVGMLCRLSLLVSHAPPDELVFRDPNRGALALVTVIREDHPMDLPIAELQNLFALTPTEARTAKRIASGWSTEQIAADMNTRPATVRWHLKRVFVKTGTRSQADLTALLQSLAFAIAVIDTN